MMAKNKARNRMNKSRKGSLKEKGVVISVLVALLLAVSFMIGKSHITGYSILENAEVIPSKQAYSIGETAHLFIFPSDADYSIGVYGPDNELIADSADIPLEKVGTYTVKVIFKDGGATKESSVTFEASRQSGEQPEDPGNHVNAASAADNIGSTPINISVATAADTSTAAGGVLIPGINDPVKDDGQKIVGRKVKGERDYETFFKFVGIVEDNFIIVFYHNSTEPLPVWVEGDITYGISKSTASAGETVNLTVPLVDGKVPKFRLHVGPDSDIFEFGINVINLQSYPTVGGNWEVRFTTSGTADLTITPIDGTEFGTDLQFLELRCGDIVLQAQYDGNSVYYSSYSCDDEGHEISRVITGGPHHLRFQFGDAAAYANNFAESTVCLSGCTYTNITDCLSAINNTDSGCVLNEPNYLYDMNSTNYKFYLPITTSDAAIRINATGITIDCENSEIKGNNLGYGIYSSAYDSASIFNCSLKGFDYGISISNSSSHDIRAVNISNTTSGLHMDGILNSVVSGMQIRNTTSFGLLLLRSSSNTLTNNTIRNVTGSSDYPGSVVLACNSSNNTLMGNTINGSVKNGIIIDTLSSVCAGQTPSQNNLTRNIISNTASSYHDLYINGSGTNAWLNHFYNGGVVDYSSSSFCIEGQGNYYGVALNRSYVENILHDCGLMNLTHPIGGEAYTGTVRINWTPQSSAYTPVYYLYYSTNAGAAWTQMNITPYTNLSWDTSSYFNKTETGVRVRVAPYDNFRYGLDYNSTSNFTVVINNNFVCSNSTICEFNNITGALIANNNTPDQTILTEANAAYTIDSGYSFYIRPDLGPAINISAPGITLDCGNSILKGNRKGSGAYTYHQSNIVIQNCIFRRYSTGINLTGSNNSRIEDSTSKENDLYGLMLKGLKGNRVENSYFTGSSSKGIYLESASSNIFSSVNSSNNTNENLYIDSNSENNTIANSTFTGSLSNDVFVAGSGNNMTANYFANTSVGYFDLNISSSASYTSVWLNNFMSQGVKNSGTGSIFCVGGNGSYYNPLINSTYRVTGSCGNLSRPYEDYDGDSYYNTLECNDYNANIRPGAQETCNNIDDNCNGLIDDGLTCPSGSQFRSAGTSGASAGFQATTYKAVDLQKEPAFLLSRFEETSFTINGAVHKLVMTKVYEDHIILTVFSQETTFELYANETKNIDLDGDNIPDMGIMLEAIVGTQARLHIAELKPAEQAQAAGGEKPAANASAGIANETEGAEPGAEAAKVEMPGVLRSLGSYLMPTLLLIILAGLFASAAYYRSVVKSIEPLENYVDEAIAKGKSKEEIRKELIEKGWEEDVINTLLGSETSTNETLKIEDYVEKALREGFSKEQITWLLEKKGWSKEQVEGVFR